MPKRRKTTVEEIAEAKAQLAVLQARLAEEERALANERAGIIGRWEYARALKDDRVLRRLREAMLPTLGPKELKAFEGFFDRLDRVPAEASNDADATASEAGNERRKAA